MAVEAGHLNLFPPQLITNRNLLNSNAGNAGTYNIQMGFGMPFTGTLQESLLPFPQSMVCDSVPVKTSVKAESGVTYNVPVAPRKRSRDSFNPISNFTVPQENNNNNNYLSELSSFLGRDIPLQIHQQQLEIDHIVAEHTNKIRVELEEKQKQHARLLVLAIGVGVMKKMKEKDEQIQRMGKLNWVLQEKVKSLYVENQLWRDLVRIERQRADAVYLELEKERLAAATAAEDIMAMILKLQNEKSLIEMEVNQYRRLMEEKQLHDQEVIHSLKWIVMKHLEDQLEIF